MIAAAAASATLRTSPLSDDDSDFSDFEADEVDLESETVNNNWLDEVDELHEIVQTSPLPKCSSQDMLKGKTVHQRAYVTNNSGLYHALCAVEDLEFANLVPAIQIVLMKSLIVQRFQPGEKIFSEGDFSFPFYIIVASDETAETAGVEVLKDAGGSERLMTRLHRGQYFGQKYFLTKQRRVRSATVRVPFDSVSVDIACLMPEQFSIWDSYRNVLLVQGVPLIQSVPRSERVGMISQAQIREFREGEYIIKQGEVGEELFIILEGACEVVEDKNFLRSTSKDDKDKLSGKDEEKVPNIVKLVTLREGHFFGEMSLMTNNPRMASVVAIVPSICLSLTKTVFRNALSAESFSKVLSTVLDERKKARKRRQSASRQKMLMAASGKNINGGKMLSSPGRRTRAEIAASIAVVESPISAAVTSVTLTSSVKMRKLSSGDKLVNKYLVVKELGKGATGEVYMVRDEETGQPYAMKVTNRYTAGWSDESSADRAIAQEIAVMKKLQHQNIVNLIEVIDDPKNRKIFLVQELMEGGALMPDSENCEPMGNEVAWTYFRDIVAGLAYLHAEGVIHRDIKPQNILLTADGTAKIADFGAAVFMDEGEGKVAYAGTPAFMSPELFQSSEAASEFSKSPAVDIFALGATLFCMVVGHPPWMANNQIDLADQIMNMDLVFPDEIILDPHLKHLLRCMLDKDHKSRIDLDGIVEDDWVTHEGSDPFFFDGGPGTPPIILESDQDAEVASLALPQLCSMNSLSGLLIDVPEALVAASPTGAGSPSYSRSSFAKIKVGTVLVVDDSPVARKLLAIQVERITGYKCQASSSGAEAVNLLLLMKESGGKPFDAIMIDHAMTHLSSLKEGRERVSLDGPATALAIRQCGYTGRIIGMCGTAGRVWGDSRLDFMSRGGVVIVLKKPLNSHQLREAIMDTADEAVISQRFMQKRDLLQTADISAAIKLLSLQAMPGTESNRNSPLNSDRSLPGERRGIQFESPLVKAGPPQCGLGGNVIRRLSRSESVPNCQVTKSPSSGSRRAPRSRTVSVSQCFEEALGGRKTVDEAIPQPLIHKFSDEAKVRRKGSSIALDPRPPISKAVSLRNPSSMSIDNYSKTDSEDNKPTPSKLERNHSSRSGERSFEHHKTHSEPFTNDFQYTRSNQALIDNADRLGRPTTELSLISSDSNRLDRKSSNYTFEEDNDRGRDGDGDGEKWCSSMPSSSRRGSYTSGNNSSHSSIDSTGLSQSTHSQSQSRNNSNGGEYDTMYGATLYLDGMMAAAAHDKSSPEKIANNVYNSSPPVQERTLTRTQDFMVVPSEVVYGPGGEKINKGIAYTALDGRMSSFKIPVSSSSYQEEAELRRLKREKAMMKSKLMRPCTERCPSNPNGSGILGGKNRPGSRTSIQKYKEGSNRMSMASNASSGGHTSTRRKSITGDKDKASRSDSSTTNVIGSPHSTLLLNGSNNSMIILQPMEGLAPLIRPRSSGMSSQYLARSGWRRESITSIGSHDSLGIQLVRDKENEIDFDSDADGLKSNTNLEEGKFSPSGKIRSRHEKLKSVGSNSSNGFRKTSPCFGKALPSTHSLHRIGEEWTGPAAGANDEEMTRYFANLSSDTGDLNKKQSVRFMGESSNGSTGFQMFRPVSMTSCVSGISETSVKQRGSGAGGDSFNSPSEGSPLLAGTLSYKKSGQIALRNLDDLDEDCVAEWADDDDIRNGGMVTNRSDYKDKLDTSPQSYQDNTESCSKSRVPDSMDEYDSDEEGLTNRLDLEHHDADGDDECYQDDGNDEECDSVASHSLDDDDEDDLGDELVHLDDDLLASALEDLCVQRPRGDPTDWQWNVISADLDIGGYLVCPANNENLKLGLRFGKAEAIGGRQYMEDRIFASSALPEEGTENFELAFFGVFDGHNGEYVADLLQTRMHAALLSHISAENVSKSLCDDGKMSEPSSPTTGGIAFNSDNEFSDSGGEGKDRGRSPGPATASLGDCFVRTAAELDLQILTRDYQRQQCSLHTGTLDVQTFAGCVLATMTVTSAPNATHYIPLPANTNPTKTDMVSWIKRDKPPRWIRKDKAMAAGIGGVNVMVGHTGDCRAVLSEKGGVARVLTGDHKPQLASEKERIEVAGGWVHNNRVNGVLAVSRSFGDIQYKTFDGTTRFLTVDEKGGIWNKTQQVISKPDILEFSVDGTHEFVVIASDGLWDVFTSQECINYVRWQLKQQGGDITRTAEALVSAAFARGTADNTSVVIVAFNQLDTSDRRIDVSGSVSVCPVISPNSKTSKSPKVFIRLP